MRVCFGFGGMLMETLNGWSITWIGECAQLVGYQWIGATAVLTTFLTPSSGGGGIGGELAVFNIPSSYDFVQRQRPKNTISPDF